MNNWRVILSWIPSDKRKRVRLKKGLMRDAKTWGGPHGDFTVEPGTIGRVNGEEEDNFSVDWVGYPTFREEFSNDSDFTVGPTDGWSVDKEDVDVLD